VSDCIIKDVIKDEFPDFLPDIKTGTGAERILLRYLVIYDNVSSS
jgi:hypothetical protein